MSVNPVELAKSGQLISHARSGPRPKTSCCLPHMQLEDNSDVSLQSELADWCFSQLPGVVEEPSRISVTGARALVLSDDFEADTRAFMVHREFAHIHPAPLGGSSHLNLPDYDAREVIDTGWGESHYLVNEGRVAFGCVMVYAPRDESDLAVVKSIFHRSYQYSKGNYL